MRERELLVFYSHSHDRPPRRFSSSFPPRLPLLLHSCVYCFSFLHLRRLLRTTRAAALERTKEVEPNEGALIKVAVLEREGMERANVRDEYAAVREGELAPAGTAATEESVRDGRGRGEGRKGRT